MKYGNLNFLEPSGLLQACNGTALPFIYIYLYIYIYIYILHTQDSGREKVIATVKLSFIILTSNLNRKGHWDLTALTSILDISELHLGPW